MRTCKFCKNYLIPTYYKNENHFKCVGCETDFHFYRTRESSERILSKYEIFSKINNNSIEVNYSSNFTIISDRVNYKTDFIYFIIEITPETFEEDFIKIKNSLILS